MREGPGARSAVGWGLGTSTSSHHVTQLVTVSRNTTNVMTSSPGTLWSAQIAVLKVSSGALFTFNLTKLLLSCCTIFLGHPMASQVLGIAWADSVESSVL